MKKVITEKRRLQQPGFADNDAGGKSWPLPPVPPRTAEDEQIMDDIVCVPTHSHLKLTSLNDDVDPPTCSRPPSQPRKDVYCYCYVSSAQYECRVLHVAACEVGL